MMTTTTTTTTTTECDCVALAVEMAQDNAETWSDYLELLDFNLDALLESAR